MLVARQLGRHHPPSRDAGPAIVVGQHEAGGSWRLQAVALQAHQQRAEFDADGATRRERYAEAAIVGLPLRRLRVELGFIEHRGQPRNRQTGHHGGSWSTVVTRRFTINVGCVGLGKEELVALGIGEVLLGEQRFLRGIERHDANARRGRRYVVGQGDAYAGTPPGFRHDAGRHVERLAVGHELEAPGMHVRRLRWFGGPFDDDGSLWIARHVQCATRFIGLFELAPRLDAAEVVAERHDGDLLQVAGVVAQLPPLERWADAIGQGFRPAGDVAEDATAQCVGELPLGVGREFEAAQAFERVGVQFARMRYADRHLAVAVEARGKVIAGVSDEADAPQLAAELGGGAGTGMVGGGSEHVEPAARFEHQR